MKAPTEARGLPLLPGLIFAAVAALLLMLGAGQPLDRAAGDTLLRHEVTGRTPPRDIVIVTIDQASLDDPQMLELAGNWPWPRAIHGELLEWLATQQPRALVLDLILSEPDVFQPASDAVLAEAAGRHGVFLPLVLLPDGTPSPLAALPASMGLRRTPDADPTAALPLLAPKALPPEVWRTGLVNFEADADGIGRRYAIEHPHRGWHLPSLPARIAADTGTVLPPQQDVTLHWYGQPFRTHSYASLYLASQRSDPGPLPELRGATVIIGTTAPGLGDLRATPLGAATPGPQILATALANLQQGDGLHPVGLPDTLPLLLLLCAGVLAAFRRQIHPAHVAVALLATSITAVLLARLLLGWNLQWQPFSALLLAWLFLAANLVHSWMVERRRREHTTRLFERFIDPRVAGQLARGDEFAEARVGSRREITVLFSDIRGFTSLSEHRSPEEIVELLNHYFALQVQCVFQHGGTVDKFIGDAIMAFWGAPADDPEHARHAVAAALEMARQLEVFRNELGEEGRDFDIGIGLHTGPAVVGFIGTDQRLDYTAIGDTVNLASRIEGQTKGVARVLVSESTCNACGTAFAFADRGSVVVKGRVQPVRLFEPMEKS